MCVCVWEKESESERKRGRGLVRERVGEKCGCVSEVRCVGW